MMPKVRSRERWAALALVRTALSSLTKRMSSSSGSRRESSGVASGSARIVSSLRRYRSTAWSANGTCLLQRLADCHLRASYGIPSGPNGEERQRPGLRAQNGGTKVNKRLQCRGSLRPRRCSFRCSRELPGGKLGRGRPQPDRTPRSRRIPGFPAPGMVAPTWGAWVRPRRPTARYGGNGVVGPHALEGELLAGDPRAGQPTRTRPVISSLTVNDPGCFALLDVALAAPRRGPGSFLLVFDGRRVGEQPAWAGCLVLMR
jgi:hypothetical protein